MVRDHAQVLDRAVSGANQDLRVNVDTGAQSDFDPVAPGTQPDLSFQYASGDPIAGQDPNVTGAAYRNSQPAAFGTLNTELFDIDGRTDALSKQDPPNNGTLTTRGSLGDNFKRIIGFDIVTRGTSPDGDKAFAALQLKGSDSSAFYRVDLDDGDVYKIGRIGPRGTDVEGLAIPINQQ